MVKKKNFTAIVFFIVVLINLLIAIIAPFLGKKSIAVLKEAEKYINNSYITRIHFRMGQEYNNIGCYDSARFFFLKCLAESPKQQFNDNAADCIDLFLQQKDTLYIYKYKDALLAINEDKLAPQYAVDYVYSKSLYYDFVQNTDSAIYYSKKYWIIM